MKLVFDLESDNLLDNVTKLYCTECEEGEDGAVALYESPPTRKPLSEDEVWRIYDEGDNVSSALEFARAVEKAHGIGV